MNITAEPEVFPLRVWFHPAKLWQATEKMSKAEADALIESLSALAECGDFDALKKYDFIRVGVYRDIQGS